MKEDKYLSELSKKKVNRIFAWVCLFVILALFVATIVLAITKSEFYLPMLLITIITPVFIYIIVWVGRVLNGFSNKEEVKEDTSDKR